MDNANAGSMVLNRLFDEANTVVEKVYTVLMGSWPAQTIVCLYVIFVGYMILMGRTGEKTKQWAVSAFLVVILGGIASNYGSFGEWVVAPIWGMAQAAASAAAGSSTDGTLSGVLDAGEKTLGEIFTVLDRVEVPGNILTNGWMYLKVFVVMLLIGGLACTQYLVMVCLLCIAIFSIMMMFMVGGPCLWLASFKETRHITWAWLKQTVNYALWIFFLGAVSGIGNSFVSKSAAILTKWDLEADGVFNRYIGSNMLLSALSIYMLLKAADWAAALTGGTSTNTGIIGAMGSMAGGAVGGGLSAAGGAAGGAAKWGAGAAINHTRAGQGLYRAYSAIKGIGQIK